MTSHNSEKEALAPCPFCGSDDISTSNNKPTFWHHWVQCNKCEGSMDAKGGTDKAIAKWNRRAAPKAPAVPETLTDAEIEAVAKTHLRAFSSAAGSVWYEGEIEFARAILARTQSAPPAAQQIGGVDA